MSLKLDFANNFSPFFLAARLCSERLSVLQPFSFKINSILTSHIPKYYAICQSLQFPPVLWDVLTEDTWFP